LKLYAYVKHHGTYPSILKFRFIRVSTLSNRIFPADTPCPLLLILFFCTIASGCAFVLVEDQLVSAKAGEQVTRVDGSCGETFPVREAKGAAAAPAELAPDSIAVLDWNIYKEQRLGWMDDFLRFSRGKDIIFLQEASLSDELLELLQREKLYWNLNSGFKYKGVETGVLVASRIDSLESCGLRYKEPVVGLPKTILINRYAIAGSAEELVVANVHGINITLGLDAYRAQFKALGDLLKNHSGPLIIGGDFNNWNDKRTAVIDLLVEDLSLTSMPFENGGRATFFGEPVDHILYRGLDPVSHMVHPVASSDHNPISVTFRLAQKMDSLQ